MSHRLVSVRDRWCRRLRGVAVLALATVLAQPLVAAAGSGARASDQVAADVVALALQQVGDPYVWGGTGPDAYDCSGLSSYVWREAGGVVLPRVSRDQQRAVVPIPREQLLPGDLVFYSVPVGHVGVYVGDGRMVDAASTRKGVLLRALWPAAEVRYGRVRRPDMPAVAPWTPPSPPAAPSASPAASPTASPSVSPVARPVVTPTARPSISPTAGPAASPRPTTPPTRPAAATPARPVPVARPAAPVAVRPLADLPAVQSAPSSPTALAAVAWARAAVGTRALSDSGLVRTAWREAGGVLLRGDRAALVARAVQVPRPQVRVGDLVSYGTPTSQVYLYAGKGFMVGSSAQHGAVVVRRVHTGDVRFLRLPG